MKATDVEARRNTDGSIDIRFSTDIAVETVSVAPEAAPLLMGAVLFTLPDVLPAHDGLRLSHLEDGAPVLQFRFGPDRWLSIVLGPLDVETIASVTRDR